MSILKVLTYPNPILKTKSEPVTKFNQELKKLLADMTETMYQKDGVGLAAIQVGKPIRAMVIDVGKPDPAALLAATDSNNPNSKSQKLIPNLVKFVNPEILEAEGETKYNEGCLSVPEIHETVVRSAKVKVKAQNEKGEEFIIDADGLLAICIQHELDHLEGILFIERLSRLKRELLKSKLKKLGKK
ncbi:MAG: peptide deformylase [Deltaproteobacteria bacterium]|nr:peptide deformylase [Deltaproteobacteria bacterium]